MNKLIGLLIIVLLWSCHSTKVETNNQSKPTQSRAEFVEKATIYEVNIRQYSEEGSFRAFTNDIPRLKDLGIDILWIMPISPIGTEKRKGGLGSPYSIKDYTAVNPEFGSLQDFKNMVRIAHDNGLLLILDWVANHTAWDHPWVEAHPDWYKKNDAGEIMPPVADWSDVAGLDYGQEALQDTMIEEMKWWVTNTNIDGLRCDVAGMVPVRFWEKASKELNSIKPMFMLAEAWEPALLEDAFDMAYAWEGHHIFNQIAQREMPITTWSDYMNKLDTMYESNDILMNFTSNHDENSWNGTVEERMGDAKELFAVFSYMIPGMPLIYNGQEYGLNKRLAFFEKDSFPKTKGKFYELYENLNEIKANYDALDGGTNAASYQALTPDNENIIAFKRSKNKQEIIFVGNFSSETQSIFPFTDVENYTNILHTDNYLFNTKSDWQMPAWSYIVLAKKR